MKSLQINPPNFVINIQVFNMSTMIFLFFSAILHQSKEDAPMEDKELGTNAYHSYFRAWNFQFSVDKISLKV